MLFLGLGLVFQLVGVRFFGRSRVWRLSGSEATGKIDPKKYQLGDSYCEFCMPTSGVTLFSVLSFAGGMKARS